MGYGSGSGQHPADRRGRDEAAIRIRPFSQPPAGEDGSEEVRGIGMSGGGNGGGAPRPRIAAFIWAEREDTPPTLPFGRWKAAT